MLPISNKFFLFLISTSTILIGGFFIKLDNYEYNHLLNLNNNYSKIILNKKSFKSMKLKKESGFDYYGNKNQYRQKISHIEDKDENVELILAKSIHPQFSIPISYKIGINSLWREILK